MLFYVLSTLFATLYSVVVLPLLPIVPMYAKMALAVFGVRSLLFICKITDGITYEIVGRENLPEGPCILASEHQSPLETLILFVEFNNVTFVLKKELKFFPILGLYFLALRMIFIDRNKRVSALKKMVEECYARGKEGRTIVIFPEGTRVKSGDDSVKNYHRGLSMVYQQVKLPVVPVAVNTGSYWPSDTVSFNKKRGKATIRLLPPIEPGLSREEFMARLSSCFSEQDKFLEKS